MLAVDSSRGRPTAEAARQKAGAIIAAAREAFCRSGYRAVTMRQIAQDANVSTRTLYNQYGDKFSLFEACLKFGSIAFPTLDAHPETDPATALCTFAVDLVEMLSRETSQSMGMLVHREGKDFPELIKASEDNQQHYLVEPLAAFLRQHDLASGDEQARAKILLSMMLSGWQRRMSFHLPRPPQSELEFHATLVVKLFLDGARKPGTY